jgi:hypothetical protein
MELTRALLSRCMYTESQRPRAAATFQDCHRANFNGMRHPFLWANCCHERARARAILREFEVNGDPDAEDCFGWTPEEFACPVGSGPRAFSSRLGSRGRLPSSISGLSKRIAVVAGMRISR